jgi:hypothetical protein
VEGARRLTPVGLGALSRAERLGALGAMRFCNAVSGGHTGAAGQFPARGREMASIAVRVPLEIVLVLRLGLPKLVGRRDLCHDAAWPQAERVDIVDCRFQVASTT